MIYFQLYFNNLNYENYDTSIIILISIDLCIRLEMIGKIINKIESHLLYKFFHSRIAPN
jgi:hypothetical protein